MQNLIDELNGILTQEMIYDNIIDFKSKDQYLIIKQIKNWLDSHPQKMNFELLYEPPFHYITPTTYSKNIQSGYKNKCLQKFEKLSSLLSKKEKGEFYENFCTLFLEDMGLIAEKTRSSGDKGIDILAYYSINLPNKLSNFFLDKNIYLLAQAKFYSIPVDTPTIRKLVGDSLFIRFDKLDYLPIAHNAIHLSVFSHSGYTKNATKFAQENKVLLFTTIDIIDFVCNENDPDALKCMKYFWSNNKNV